MSALASAPPNAAVPCLAGLYVALGADDPHTQPVTGARRRLGAAVAASLLALSVVAWPAVPVIGSEQAPVAAGDRPAATLPEWPELLPGDSAGD